ncbi:MAG: patatin-like phospholipase family protein [Xanthomonadales bacterium]|nr:patatin-like phospholipase family protein [Xanthomonadales bacterium]ODU92000.1 MAG: serine protease [Rhodanobacter sp. SCN 66-43]OJY84944.1 MAG: serine protease [Xanthomonadales bacterium 66-474]
MNDRRELVVQPHAQPTVALALGTGGARGLAHIGAIEAVAAAGYRITAVSGSSMGALIGGIHAAGKLDVYRDWVCALQKMDVLKLVDWTLSGAGLIKGDRIIGVLRELIGPVNIEDLPIPFTAVATDLDREREIWLTRGPLFDAIRASIAIPTIFRPHPVHGHRLVDGGLMNPLPLTPLLQSPSDYTVAVNVNGSPETLAASRAPAKQPARTGLRSRVAAFVKRTIGNHDDKETEPGWMDTLTQSLDLMQQNLTGFRLAADRPDLVIEIPRNASAVYEFYRASELIELGRERAERALAAWQPQSRG